MADTPPTKQKRPFPWVLVLLIVLVVTGGVVAYDRLFDTYHFAEVQPGILYRDGVRKLHEFEIALRKGNIKTVVMLNDDLELQEKPRFKEELELCRQKGIEVVRIPVELGGRPTSADIQKFLDVAVDKQKQPVLVHCAQGVRRTAMMVAAYQESVLNYPDEKAKEEVMPWGRDWENLADIRGFIEDYDPATRTVKPTTQPGIIDEID